jgi:hypothetical protein
VRDEGTDGVDDAEVEVLDEQDDVGSAVGLVLLEVAQFPVDECG